MRLLLLFGVAVLPSAVSAAPSAAVKHATGNTALHASSTSSSFNTPAEKVWVAKQNHDAEQIRPAPHALDLQERSQPVWVAQPELAVEQSPKTGASGDPAFVNAVPPAATAIREHQASIPATQLQFTPLPQAATAWVAQQAVESGVSQPASAPLVSGSMAAFTLPMGVEPTADADVVPKEVWVADGIQEAAQAPIVSPSNKERRRSPNPIARITTDSVEAVADLLPWVDRKRKDEPIEDVLTRVADELARARAADPEWVLPAEQELRALAKRIGTLPAPPLGQTADHGPLLPTPPSRSYALRPLWPGADGAPEVRRRPMSPTTESGFDMGPSSIADSIGPYIDPDAPPPKQGPDTKARQSSVPQKSPKHSAPKH
jgi:hypothetical protein